MKAWLLRSPGKNGALAGALLLAILRAGPILALAFTIRSSKTGIPFLTALWTFGGLVWGAILGTGAAEAFAAWSQGNYRTARTYCFEFGLWSAAFCFAWTIPVGFFFHYVTHGRQREFIAIMVVYCLFHVCFPAASALSLVGFLLPKYNRDEQIPMEAVAPIRDPGMI